MVHSVRNSVSPQRNRIIPKSAQKIGLTPSMNMKPIGASNVLASFPNDKVTITDSIQSSDSCIVEKYSSSVDIRLQKECFNLLHNKQYRSCEMLTMYHVSALSGTDQETTKLKAIAYEILGDSIMQQDQAYRAIAYYRRAITNLRASIPPVTRTIGNVLHVQTVSEANLKLKESRCLSKMGNTVEAASVLEVSVPITHHLRTFSISMELGNLHMVNGRMRDAQRSFIDALSRNVYSLEAIEKLVILNTERSEVMSVINSNLQSDNKYQNENQENKEGLAEDILPISDIVTSYFYSHRSTQSHQQNALNQWKKLHSIYPQNVHVLLQMALLQVRNPALEHNPNSAKITFEKIRTLDSKFIEGMDRYALILYNLKDTTNLSRLALEFINITDKQPESFSTLALYHGACGDQEKALDMISKALSLDLRNAFCHSLKGRIQLLQHQPDLAAASFFHANEIEKDLNHYECMVECVILAKRYKEAVAIAKEAMNFAPRDCRALTLVGIALSKAASSSSREVSATRDRAIKALKKAISLDPSALRPVLALIDLYMADSNFEECEHLLKSAIDLGSNTSIQSSTSTADERLVSLQTRLADVYAENQQFVKALTHYHRALSLDPKFEKAKQGVETLEMAIS